MIARELSAPTLNSNGSSTPFGLVNVPFKYCRSFGKSSSGISKLAAQSDPTVGTVGSSITIIEKGLFGTCLPSFLTLTKCSPASVGTNDTAIVPSGPNFTSTGSSLPVGLLNVPFILLISLRLQGSGWKNPFSHGCPTFGYWSGEPSTMITNGLSSICLLSLKTFTICFPGSSGVNDNDTVSSGAASTPHGSSLPFGLVNIAVNFGTSFGKSQSAKSIGTALSSPITGFSRTITGIGEPSIGLLRFLTWSKFFPGSSGTKEAIMESFGPSATSTGFSFPEGACKTPLSDGISLPVIPSGDMHKSDGRPTSTAGSSCTIFGLNGLPGTCWLSNFTMTSYSPEKKGGMILIGNQIFNQLMYNTPKWLHTF